MHLSSLLYHSHNEIFLISYLLATKSDFNKQDPTFDRFYYKNISHIEYKSSQNISEPENIYTNEVFL